MTGRSWRRWAVVLSLGVLCIDAPAAAAAPQGQFFRPTGSLTYTWRGDPSLGCASRGLCGTDGELVLRGLDAILSGSGEGAVVADLDLAGTVRVTRDDGTGSAQCIDPAYAAFPGSEALLRRRSWVLSFGFSSGRCAGPLGSEVARVALPLRRRGQAYDLRGHRSFSAGPFAVTVVSTLRLQPMAGENSGSSGSLTTVTAAPHPPRTEHIELRYRVALVPSVFAVSFAGPAGQYCQFLDACGTHGTLSLGLGPLADLTVTAAGRIRGHRPARPLRDLGLGRLRPSGTGIVRGDLAETLSRADGSSCQDSVSGVGLSLNIGQMGPPAPMRRGNLPVTLALGPASGLGSPADAFRTHCQGPVEEDLFGVGDVMASGSIGADALLRHRTAIPLLPSRTFASGGYSGSAGTPLRLELTLVHVKAGTTR